MTKYLFIVLLFVAANLKAQNKALSPRNANYDMDVQLNPDTKIIKGKMKLKWINISPDTLNELQFHLFLNGFKNSESTFMKESGGHFRGDKAGNDQLSWGYINVKSMKIEGGENLTGKIQFISPDDGNKNDQTVIRVPLSDSILPGDTLNILIDFESKLPKIFARTGFAGNYFLVGQWFPKIGVYEPAGMRGRKTGAWNCHQFHAHSEFYADYGVYNVKITLPKDYIVGATGKQLSETLEGNLKTVKYRAKDVIDFAWTASPRFKVVMDKWNHVQIKLLIQPEHADLADRHIESVKAALAYFNEHLGPYPYTTLTIIDPPVTGGGSAGMEYPTFITAGSFAKMPEGLRLIEMVTVHEFGHQYFMGILATNEFEEAWMDEGMNSYFETQIMDDAYGEKTSFLEFGGIKMGDLEMQRNGYIYNKNRKVAESYRYAWNYQQGGYSTMSYNKPATFLNTLNRLVGDSLNDKIWKTYYNEWKFQHPSTSDFIKVVNNVVTEHKGLDFATDINDFLVQAIYGSEVCDYKVDYIRSRWINDPQGILDGLQLQGNADSAKIYESRVVIVRDGEMIMPVEILIHFNNGKEITKYWDGKARSTEFKFRSVAKVDWAKIDPHNKNLMDVNLANNSYVVRPDDKPAWKYAVKFLFWLQNIIQSVVWFV